MSKTKDRIYCSHPCYAVNKVGEKNENWKGGKYLSNWGYYYIRAPKKHPQKAYNGYIFEHRLVMEKHIGRYLKPTEHVHHINGIKTDNRIENLVIITKAQHNTIHFKNKPSHLKGKPKTGDWKRDPKTGRYT